MEGVALELKFIHTFFHGNNSQIFTFRRMKFGTLKDHGHNISVTYVHVMQVWIAECNTLCGRGFSIGGSEEGVCTVYIEVETC
jgi:hypothetical protein